MIDGDAERGSVITHRAVSSETAWKEVSEENKWRNPSGSPIFGDRLFNTILPFTQDPETISSAVTRERNQLQQLYKNPKTRRYVEDLYYNYRIDNSVIDEKQEQNSNDTSREDRRYLRELALTDPILQKLLDVMPPVKEDLVEIDSIFDPNQTPNDQFIKILENNREQQLKKRAALEERAKVAAPVILANIKQAIVDNKIPPIDNLDEKFQRAKVVLVDPLVVQPEEILADCDPDTHVIRVMTSMAFERFQKVLTHEYMHALSGKTNLETVTQSDDSFVDVEYTNIRVGLRVWPKYHWLNEAVTMNLEETVDTQPYTGMDFLTYDKEKQLFELLLSKGKKRIPKMMSYQAYFEEYDEEKRLPHTSAFFNAVNESYSPGFLARLDKFVTQNGIDAAIKQMRKSPAAI